MTILKKPVARVLSMGAGVQSSTVGFMAKHGDIPPFDFAVFADTGAEPQPVYDWLAWMETQLPFPIIRAKYGDLPTDSVQVRRSKKSGRTYLRTVVPTFIKKANGKKGMLRRKCTRDYKINTIKRAVIAELGLSIRDRKNGVVVQQAIGISTDEIGRVAVSRDPWSENHYPLIEAGMSRTDCLMWMQAHGYPFPPRSACTFCPYHSDDEWLRMKTQDPASFQQAVEYEQTLQEAQRNQEVLLGTPFLHASLLPLAEVEFKPGFDPAVEWHGECEGMCGL